MVPVKSPGSGFVDTGGDGEAVTGDGGVGAAVIVFVHVAHVAVEGRELGADVVAVVVLDESSTVVAVVVVAVTAVDDVVVVDSRARVFFDPLHAPAIAIAESTRATPTARFRALTGPLQ
jgi:hypothetical protein